ncbi:MAG: hypothetical protein AB7U83_12465 [Vicinamibacterales bacterium]
MPAPWPSLADGSRAVVVVLAAVASTGCLDVATRITVRPDGSGTITQRLLVSTRGLEDALGGLGFKPSGSASRRTPPNAADLRTDAGRAGEGVALVSVTPTTAPDGFEGAEAVYAFRDIRKLRADEFLMPGPAGGGGDSRIAVRFTKTPQGTSLLALAFDERPAKKASAGAGPGPQDFSDLGDAKAREMVKTMFRGFKVRLDLEVEGEVVRTVADHVDGRRITLLAVDMDALFADEQALARLEGTTGAELVDLRPLLAGIDGITVNRPIVKIEFR